MATRNVYASLLGTLALAVCLSPDTPVSAQTSAAGNRPDWTVGVHVPGQVTFHSRFGDEIFIADASAESCATALETARRMVGGSVGRTIASPDGKATQLHVTGSRGWRTVVTEVCHPGRVTMIIANVAGPDSDNFIAEAVNRILDGLGATSTAPPKTAYSTGSQDSVRDAAAALDQGLRDYQTFRSTMDYRYGR